LVGHIPINFGGTHTCQASFQVVSSLVGFEFWPIARPKPKEVLTMKVAKGSKKKKRVLLNASDSDSSLDEESKVALTAAKAGKKYLH